MTKTPIKFLEDQPETRSCTHEVPTTNLEPCTMESQILCPLGVSSEAGDNYNMSSDMRNGVFGETTNGKAPDQPVEIYRIYPKYWDTANSLPNLSYNLKKVCSSTCWKSGKQCRP